MNNTKTYCRCQPGSPTERIDILTIAAILARDNFVFAWFETAQSRPLALETAKKRQTSSVDS